MTQPHPHPPIHDIKSPHSSSSDTTTKSTPKSEPPRRPPPSSAAAMAGGSSMLGRVGSLSDMVFGFFDEAEGFPSPEWEEVEDDDGEDEEEESAEKTAFWESQRQLLDASLASSRSSLETKVSRATQAALRKIRAGDGGRCSCSRRNVSGSKECRGCLLKDISDELRNAGFDCGLCKSKWRSSPGIPSGEHSYLDVVHKSTNSKKSPTRVVIELNFRGEFEMARASEHYKSLVRTLPEVFVGKPEKLKGVIKTMCTAAKRCMKDNKMHMGPWRKYKYMQAKWLASSSERVVLVPEATKQLQLVEGSGVDRRPSRPRASLLTFDLSGKLPGGFHYTAVEVG